MNKKPLFVSAGRQEAASAPGRVSLGVDVLCGVDVARELRHAVALDRATIGSWTQLLAK